MKMYSTKVSFILRPLYKAYPVNTCARLVRDFFPGGWGAKGFFVIILGFVCY